MGEDPVELLQAAARDHVPVNPKANSSSHERMDVPSPENRPSVDDVITEIQKQEGYGNQIVDRRTFTAREAREGTFKLHHIHTKDILIAEDRFS